MRKLQLSSSLSSVLDCIDVVMVGRVFETLSSSTDLHSHHGGDKDSSADKLGAPEAYFCPISMHLMRDPVLITTGQTYVEQLSLMLTQHCLILLKTFGGRIPPRSTFSAHRYIARNLIIELVQYYLALNRL